jgi:hypothetical protein
MKAALPSPHMFPRVAIVDSAVCLTMPPLATAMTGFGALTHGIESYLNAIRSNPASDLLALETVRKFVDRIGLSAVPSPAATDEGLFDCLTDEVFRYMGRPVQQHLPVFSRAEIRQIFMEALDLPMVMRKG